MSLDKIKEHFIGKKLSCGRINVEKYGKILVDFAEIRIFSYSDVPAKKLKCIENNHDCYTESIGINVCRIVPNLVKNYEILSTYDGKLREELSTWFDKHFVDVVKVIFNIQ